MSELTVVFPCHAGDTVYMLANRMVKKDKKKICEKFIITGTVDHFTVGETGVPLTDICLTDGIWCEACKEEEYYLTKEAAEKALEEWKKED